jgi:hypothetical protein
MQVQEFFEEFPDLKEKGALIKAVLQEGGTILSLPPTLLLGLDSGIEFDFLFAYLAEKQGLSAELSAKLEERVEGIMREIMERGERRRERENRREAKKCSTKKQSK